MTDIIRSAPLPPSTVLEVLAAKDAEITRLRADLNAALADAIKAHDKLTGVHDSARAHRDRVRELEAECASLRAEVEGLRKDAERYRWLKESESLQWPSVDLANACHSGDGKLIDAEIDRQSGFYAITKGATC